MIIQVEPSLHGYAKNNSEARSSKSNPYLQNEDMHRPST